MDKRWALVAPVPGLVLVLTLAPPSVQAPSDRQVLLLVQRDRSYGQWLEDALMVELASVGGLGLVTTSGRADVASKTAINVGAGRSARDVPDGPVPFDQHDGQITVDVVPYTEAAGDAIPGLLGSTLSEAGLTVGYVDPSSAAGEVALLAAMDRAGRIPAAVLDGSGSVAAIVDEADLLVSPDPELVTFALERTEAGEVLVVVVGAGASPSMRERGDTVAPIAIARGSPDELFAGGDGPAGLTSSTTRRDGIVADVDVAPTILDFLGVPIPDDMVGAPIGTSEGPPSDLHERYLQFRGVAGPVSAVILGLAVTSLVAGLAVVFVAPSRGVRGARVVGLAMLAALALFVATVPASVLPDFSWTAVIGCLVVVGAALLALAVSRGRRDPSAAVATLAVSGLVAVVLDGVLGWPSQLTPLLGGGALDGERFFGLGNAHAGILLAGAVLGAARLPPPAGLGLIVAAAAFAGLPFLGADLGGCLTLAIAAALWFGLARWRNLGWRTWALTAAVALGTVLLVAVADRVMPGGRTHLSGVTETGAGLGGPAGALLDRLISNVRTTSANASAWLAVLGLPIWLLVALRPPEALRPTLEADPRWRDAIVVLALAGIAGYLLNDTYGLAGSAFAFVSAAMLYPTLGRPSEAHFVPVGGLEPPAGAWTGGSG